MSVTEGFRPDWRHHVDPWAVLARLNRALRSLAGSVLDPFPPYRRIEGRLDAKEALPDGGYFILVSDEIVELDRLTFETLSYGEALRIRCTRSNRAISIDRLVP